VLPNEFLQNDELSVASILKIFSKICMFRLLLCLGTILAPSCPASCQPAAHRPPHLGPLGRHHSTLSAALRQPLCSSAQWPPLLHHPSRVTRQGGCHQPP
jgi:hypothetical protein